MPRPVTCHGCGEAFEARSVRAKWCSDRCRKAAGKQSARVAASETVSVPVASGLVAAVERELVKAKAVESFAGQLALQLAARLTDPDEAGISGLSKELRTVLAAALEGKVPGAAERDDDEVSAARRARESKARKAAARA